MKKIVLLLVVVGLFVTAGCFNDKNVNIKQTGAEKIKELVENDKRASVVKNGIYVKGTTTILYTFIDFMELSIQQQSEFFLNTKAYIVYKDRYIDMVTFGSDDNVTAASFLNGTNGVKSVVDESVIPSTVYTKLGVLTTSGTEAFRGILNTISVKTAPTKVSYNIGETLDITGLVVTGSYSDGTTKTETVSVSDISGFSSTAAGAKTLTITVRGKTTTFTVTVVGGTPTPTFTLSDVSVASNTGFKLKVTGKDFASNVAGFELKIKYNPAQLSVSGGVASDATTFLNGFAKGLQIVKEDIPGEIIVSVALLSSAATLNSDLVEINFVSKTVSSEISITTSNVPNVTSVNITDKGIVTVTN